MIRELKKEQLTGEDVLPHYQKRLAEIEDILRNEQSDHAAGAARDHQDRHSGGDGASSRRPTWLPPPLLNNHGERGAFVLPLETQGANGTTLEVRRFHFRRGFLDR